MQKENLRLNKYLAICGMCSRREADELILDGKVYVNGIKAECGTKVTALDKVVVENREVKPIERKVVLAFYKPIGVTCSEKDKYAEKLITDLIQYPIRVTYAGRLDKDSEGLLILTNDGDLINAMMRGANGHEKEYIVKVKKEITGTFLSRMQSGIYLKELEKKTRPCRVEKIGKYTFRITLTQGLNRQIRRMCKELGYDVISLKRVRVLNIQLGDLTKGTYRELEPKEQEELYKLCGMLGEGREL